MAAKDTAIGTTNSTGILSELLQTIVNYSFGSIGIAILVATVAGVALGFSKRVVFYTDYNDLGLAAAMCALPALILFIGVSLVPQSVALGIAGVVFIGLLVKTAMTTYQSNERSIWKTILVLIAKLVMSFLFVFHLLGALTAKTRRKRGGSWFVLVILTPLLIALVKEQKGIFSITSTGRVRMR